MRVNDSVILEENPGVYVTVRNCESPEFEYRIDADSLEIKFRVDDAEWKRVEL